MNSVPIAHFSRPILKAAKSVRAEFVKRRYSGRNKMSMKAVIFDFGGVLAEEGFKAGINEIALSNGLQPEELRKTAFEAVYDTGFVKGRIRDKKFWDLFRKKTGIKGTNEELTQIILSRFELRSFMLETVKRLRTSGVKTYILSDQTHWIEDLNQKTGFFTLFDKVYNSYRMGMTKKQPETFDLVINSIGFDPEDILFIDDHAAHIRRAQEKYLHTIWYTEKAMFFTAMKIFFPELDFKDLED